MRFVCFSPVGGMAVFMHPHYSHMVVKRGIKQVFFCPLNTVYIADCFHWLI